MTWPDSARHFAPQLDLRLALLIVLLLYEVDASIKK